MKKNTPIINQLTLNTAADELSTSKHQSADLSSRSPGWRTLAGHRDLCKVPDQHSSKDKPMKSEDNRVKALRTNTSKLDIARVNRSLQEYD